MKNVFIDTDIILDLFSKRMLFYVHAALLFNLIDAGKLRGYVSSLIFSNLFYILRKEKSRKQAISILNKLKILVTVLPVDGKIIQLALSSGFNDFEDAIQYYTAKQHKIDFIITRNIKDYKLSDIQAITAAEFIKIIQ